MGTVLKLGGLWWPGNGLRSLEIWRKWLWLGTQTAKSSNGGKDLPRDGLDCGRSREVFEDVKENHKQGSAGEQSKSSEGKGPDGSVTP